MEVLMETCLVSLPVFLDMLSFPDTSDLRPLIIGIVILVSFGLIIAAVFLLDHFLNKKK
jgi:hypothetical protein